MGAMLVYGRNSDKGGDLTDVGASAIGRAINKEFNLMDAGCWPLQCTVLKGISKFFRCKVSNQMTCSSSVAFELGRKLLAYFGCSCETVIITWRPCISCCGLTVLECIATRLYHCTIFVIILVVSGIARGVVLGGQATRGGICRGAALWR